MPFDWNDLSETEQKLVEHVAAGSIYDGGWEFRLSTDRDVMAATGVATDQEWDAPKHAVKAPDKIQFWRARLAEEEADRKRTRIPFWKTDGADEEAAKKEIEAIQASLEAKIAEFEKGIESVPPFGFIAEHDPKARFWHNRLVEEENDRRRLSSLTVTPEIAHELEETGAEVKRIQEKLRAALAYRELNYPEFGELRDRWKALRADAGKLDEIELAKIEKNIADLLRPVIDALSGDIPQKAEARRRFGDFAARRASEKDSLQSSGWMRATETDGPIRPALIKELYLGLVRDEKGQRVAVPSSGIRIRHARLADTELDLREIAGASALPPLVLEGCFLGRHANIEHCRIQQISLRRSILPWLKAEGVRCEGEVSLEGVILGGDERLYGKHKLDFSRARLNGAVTADFLSCSKDDGKPEIDFAHASVIGLLRCQSSFGGASRAPGAGASPRLLVSAPSAQFGSQVDFFNVPLSNLNLSHATVRSQVMLQSCDCEGGVDLTYAKVSGYADFNGMKAASLDCTGAQIGGDASLLDARGNRAEISNVIFAGAKIEGYLAMSGCHVGSLLNLTSAKIDGSLFIGGCHVGEKGVWAHLLKVGGNIDASFDGSSSFQCKGPVYLHNARIAGNVDFQGASLGSGDGWAFFAQALNVGGNLSLSASWGFGRLVEFMAEGRISVTRAEITGALAMQGAVVKPHASDLKDADAVDFSMARIGTGVFLRAEEAGEPPIRVPGLESEGCVTFIGAEIGTGFDAEGADLQGGGPGRRGYIALDLRNATIKGPVWLGQARRCGDCGPRFTSKGTITLSGAVISGSVELNHADLKELVPDDIKSAAISMVPVAALDAEGVQIDGHLYLGKRPDADPEEKGLSAEGPVILDRIKVGGDLKLTGGSFRRSKKNETNKEALSLRNARVAGNLDIEDKPQDGKAATRGPIGRLLRRLRRLLWWMPKDLGEYAIERDGIFDLTGASFVAINDDGGTGWGPSPKKCKQKQNTDRLILRLDGCVYDRFEKTTDEEEVSQQRKVWLSRQYEDPESPKRSEYRPRSYEQVIKVFQQSGDHDHARKVAIAYGQIRRRCAINSWFGRRLNGLYGLTTRYGYSPGRAMMTLVVYFAIGCILAFLLIDNGWINAKSDRLSAALKVDSGCSLYCRASIAMPYTLDAMLPALRMGAQNEWDIAIPPGSAYAPSASAAGQKVLYPWIRFFKLIYAAIGTALLALAVLTWTGVLRRGRTS
ncbi:MAG: hypothetical protein ACLPIX_21505 [Rhodomicrobium sp.]